MDWIEITLTGPRESSEAMSAIFYDVEVGGVVIDDPLVVNNYIDSGLWDYTDLKKSEDISTVKVTAYFAKDEKFDGKFKIINERFLNLQKEFKGDYKEILCKNVKDEDWENSWKAYFHTEKIGDKTVIRPPWENYEPKENEVIVAIDPGAAFGTGQHPTTALAIRALEQYVKNTSTVFDIGTGSGVLAISAAKLGAKNIVAMDYDSTAARIARENAALNNITNMNIGVSDLFQNFSGTADIIVANIIADIILRLLPDVPSRLNDKGIFIAGGIIDERLDEILNAVKDANLKIISVEHKAGWSLVVSEKIS